ncbi:hypothetical protein FSP39_003585 [Pinctada imbricata]|uniref:DDHD domain-containing protein n=1 Tax=Pinctada imbricata TaxID=66713 RepID=A0AA89BVC2_PINIB|nr:hypothetical protein FSP39_003585 [Pinctada imbricata]
MADPGTLVGQAPSLSLAWYGGSRIPKWDRFYLYQKHCIADPEHFYAVEGSFHDISASRMFESIERLQETSSDEEEFFDAKGNVTSADEQEFWSDEGSDTESEEERPSLARTSSLDLAGGEEFTDAVSTISDEYNGNILDCSQEHLQASKRSDFSTVKAKFEQVIQTQYPGAMGRIAFRLVPCPQICAESLGILSSLSPFGFDSPTHKIPDSPLWTQEFIPLGAISLFATSNPDYHEYVNKMVAKANLVYQDFLLSEEGKGFNGQVCFLSDATGSLLAYDALSLSNHPYNRGMSTYDSRTSLNENEPVIRQEQTSINVVDQQLSKSDIVSSEYKLRRQHSHRHSAYLSVGDHGQESCRRTSTGSYFDGNYMKFDFEVTDFFMLGSPLGLILAYRRIFSGEDKFNAPPPPACHQVYNMFHSSDPVAVRLEPLIHSSFKHIAPVKLSRFNKFPIGDGEPIHVVETVQSNLSMFTGNRRASASLQRQNSITSVGSQISGIGESAVSTITNVTSRWWGNKRVDYMLYCPEVLHSFPVSALPHLFHASFWESNDAMAFILRQVLRHDMSMGDTIEGHKVEHATEVCGRKREKWLKRRTTIKVKNLQPNHRGNDVIVLEDKAQILTARFMYGPFDVTSLSGEKVDIHVMEQSTAEWRYLTTEITDKHGRLTYNIPTDKALPNGMHQVKIVVRGDHSTADFYLTVLPPKTETVIFSIDGSFTASMSISGKDPKVRAGAVDVVRHWQDQGYLILYVTARPDMQHRRVVAWLAMHNFPHGMVAFMDGLSKEPLKQKLNYLKSLKNDAQVSFKAAYGSSKDIYVYKELGMTTQQIFVIGKASKKYLSQAQVLCDGYSAHLNNLLSMGTTRPAVGNARLFIQKGWFCLPHQSEGKKPVKRMSSNQSTGGDFLNKSGGFLQTTISVGADGNTVVQQGKGGGSRTRGSSPQPKIGLKEVPR